MYPPCQFCCCPTLILMFMEACLYIAIVIYIMIKNKVMSYFNRHNMAPPPKKKRFNLIYIDDTYYKAFTKRFWLLDGWGYRGQKL